MGGVAAYGFGTSDTTEDAHRKVAREHGRLVKAFAEYFHLDPEVVQLAQGEPGDVLPDVAESLDADLIVMGARNLKRWQRMLRRTTAEPVLAASECEVLFVKEPSGLKIPAAAADDWPVVGNPAIDVEAAILHPEQAFDSPTAVSNASSLSRGLRERILAAWDHDIRAQLLEENEGGQTKAIDTEVLGEIRSAMESLRAKSDEYRRETAESLLVAN